MEFCYNDGGRSEYYKAKHVGDCVTRAIAIANGWDYKFTYDLVKRYNGGETPRNGVSKIVYKKLLADYGWEWTPCCGKGIIDSNIHMSASELPDGIVICRLSKHLATVIDGVLYDTYDCTRNETRKVYGYWIKK